MEEHTGKTTNDHVAQLERQEQPQASAPIGDMITLDFQASGLSPGDGVHNQSISESSRYKFESIL